MAHESVDTRACVSLRAGEKDLECIHLFCPDFWRLRHSLNEKDPPSLSIFVDASCHVSWPSDLRVKLRVNDWLASLRLSAECQQEGKNVVNKVPRDPHAMCGGVRLGSQELGE